MAERLPNPRGVLDGRPFAPEAWIRAAGEASPILFAWELARIPKELDPPARRRLHLLISLLLAAQAQGSTRLALGGPTLAALHQAFGEIAVDWGAFLEDPRLAGMVGTPDSDRPLVLGAGFLTTRRMFAAEQGVAARIRDLAAAPPAEDAIPEALLDAPLTLTEEQRRAVRGAVAGRIALITGGPGTGKTAILAALIRALVASGLDPESIALASPTGKAAQRMGQSLSRTPVEGLPEPRTLHRLLGWDPRLRRFRHGPGHPLRVAALVVDESSMVGLELMDALLAALPPGAKLVLLGDAGQLPSVEAGTVFRDLVTGLPERTFRLTRSHRMDAADPAGRAILEAARAVGAGEAPVLREAEPSEDPGAPGIALWPSDDPALRAYLRRWLAQYARPDDAPFRLEDGRLDPADAARLADLLARWDAGRLLCLLREGEGLRSSEGLNAFLHGEALREARPGQPQGHFLPGEPVMVRHNDALRGLFNGDQGLVARVARDGHPSRLEAAFPRPDGFVFFPLDSLQAGLDHAYALTVHKAQGSEYDRVALVLPTQDHPLLTREILYTALTRAKRSVAVLGDPALLAAGAARTLRREGGLVF
ncbi:MAG: exodeoxyribonuclease V subunit alpha [Geothrix sp.]|nr:exodeoxyribonuclease V subunit alpha [Geothrix sp.]